MDGMPLLTPTRQALAVARWRGHYAAAEDVVAEETPIGLEYNGVPHVVMLATPADLEDFAIGFSLTEGIVEKREDITAIALEEYSAGIRVQITIPEHCVARLEQKRQNLAGRTGCGLCGTERLAQVFRPMADVTTHHTLSIPALEAALEDLPRHQSLQQSTGATHAAFWLDAAGHIVLAREDVGRHNALDKLFGALARAHFDPTRGSVLITSRASYEMVQKTIQRGVGILVAISAPTALAVRMAEQFNLTLAGFARNGRHVAYAHPERLTER